PPSSVIIIIAWLSKLSVGEMFLAGAIPGILIALTYLALTIFISIKRKYPREPRASLKEIGRSFLSASLTLILPIFLVLSIALRSEEHTSELQSRFDLVCRLLLEKKKHNKYHLL